jgi:hypothetical protein
MTTHLKATEEDGQQSTVRRPADHIKLFTRSRRCVVFAQRSEDVVEEVNHAECSIAATVDAKDVVMLVCIHLVSALPAVCEEIVYQSTNLSSRWTPLVT